MKGFNLDPCLSPSVFMLINKNIVFIFFSTFWKKKIFESQREKERDFPTTCSLPRWAQCLGLVQDDSRSESGGRGQAPAPSFFAFPGSSRRDLMGSGAAATQTHVHVGWQHSRWQLYSLHDIVDANTFIFSGEDKDKYLPWPCSVTSSLPSADLALAEEPWKYLSVSLTVAYWILVKLW